jgi:hypothetical protein
VPHCSTLRCVGPLLGWVGSVPLAQQDFLGSAPSSFPVHTEFIADIVALLGRHAGRQAGDVEEKVFAARVRLYETKALIILEQLNYSTWHYDFLLKLKASLGCAILRIQAIANVF